MIYIGEFLHLTNQEDGKEQNRRHGSFNMIVEADSVDKAVFLFREQLEDYRENKNFFEGACRIYLMQLLEFEKFPKSSPLMFNFTSIAGDPTMPFIGCSLPTEKSDACKIFEWEEGSPEVDGDRRKLFLEF
jgi:hypothetical protein